MYILLVHAAAPFLLPGIRAGQGMTILRENPVKKPNNMKCHIRTYFDIPLNLHEEAGVETIENYE